MLDHPAATPLDDAALALCEAQGVNPHEHKPASDGVLKSNQHAARPAAAAAVAAYLDQLANEPFFLSALEATLAAQGNVKSAALAAIQALHPDAVGGLFPAIEAEVEAPDMTGIEIAWLGGHCPVQAEGSVDRIAFYFRARGSHWEIWIGDQRRCFTDHPDIWSYREPFRTWPEAGWMSESLARRYIAEGVARWRREKTA